MEKLDISNVMKCAPQYLDALLRSRYTKKVLESTICCWPTEDWNCARSWKLRVQACHTAQLFRFLMMTWAGESYSPNGCMVCSQLIINAIVWELRRSVWRSTAIWTRFNAGLWPLRKHGLTTIHKRPNSGFIWQIDDKEGQGGSVSQLSPDHNCLGCTNWLPREENYN